MITEEVAANPDFNLNDAEPVSDAFVIGSEFAPPPDFTAIDKKVLPARDGVAQSAVTAEDLAFEAALQRVHVESPLPKSADEVVLTPEAPITDFLGDIVENYKPASTLNELEQQVFMAKSRGITAIEATDDIIRYYTRTNFPSDVGYFIFKDIRVFITGRHSGFVQTDTQNINNLLRGM